MTDGHPGWFKDPSDPALARWHDGDNWTDHTLVIADQTPGVEPAPPVIAPLAAEETYFPRHRSDTGEEDDDTSGGIPAWAKVVAPLVVVLVGVLGFSLLSGDDDGGNETTTEDTQPASLSDAVDEARDAGLPSAISDARASALIERICAAARRPSNIPQLGNDLGQLPVTSASELRTSIDALGEGAEERCANDLVSEPELIDDLQDQAFLAFGTSTTSPTITGDSIPVEGEGETTGTTKAGSTVTTRPRTSTTKPTTTTTAPATTTTVNDIQQNFPCSPEGASATDKFGKSVTCRKACSGTSQRLTWQRGPCATVPTAPESSSSVAP